MTKRRLLFAVLILAFFGPFLWFMLRPQEPSYAGKPVTFLRDKNPPTRQAAADALLYLGTDARPAVPALIIALHDSDGLTRAYAESALGKIDPDALKQANAKPAAQKQDRLPACPLPARSLPSLTAGRAI